MNQDDLFEKFDDSQTDVKASTQQQSEVEVSFIPVSLRFRKPDSGAVIHPATK